MVLNAPRHIARPTWRMACAVFAMLVALAGFAPSAAVAEEPAPAATTAPTVTIQITATAKTSNMTLDPIDAGAIAEAAQAKPGVHSQVHSSSAQVTATEEGAAWICGNISGNWRSHALASIVISDAEGHRITFEAKNTALSAKFDPKESLTGKHELGANQIFISESTIEANSRVGLTFRNLPTSITVTYHYLVADPYSIAFTADNEEIDAYDRWRGDAFGEAPSAPAKDGFIFTGWQDATGATYDPTATVKGNATYTAIYAPAYTISWDLGGGTLNGQTAIPNLINPADASFTLPEGTPVRDGYLFKGWAVSGTSTALDPSKTYTPAEIASAGTTQATIVAQWEKKPETTDPTTPPDTEKPNDGNTTTPTNPPARPSARPTDATPLPATGDSAAPLAVLVTLMVSGAALVAAGKHATKRLGA